MDKKSSESLRNLLFLLVISFTTSAAADQNKYDECLLRVIKNATADMTAHDLRDACTAEKLGTVEPISEELLEDEKNEQKVAALDQRLERESQTELRPWVLTPHKPNYFLPVSYNSDPYNEPYQAAIDDEDVELDDIEVKFQLSLKVPIAIGLFDDRANIFAAYTNTSWWQAYNSDVSAPFRETNHEPELFMTFNNDWEILGFKNRLNGLGIVHQSNGRSEPLSRSWNRIYANFLFERGGLGVSLKPWYRIKEDEETDNNPDITDYLGYGDIKVAYKNNKQTYSMMVRKKALELTWSRLTWGNIRLYAQYFHGYGQSLIEYDKSSDVFGVGFAFSDWL
jgi:phospholipase A1